MFLVTQPVLHSETNSCIAKMMPAQCVSLGHERP